MTSVLNQLESIQKVADAIIEKRTLRDESDKYILLSAEERLQDIYIDVKEEALKEEGNNFFILNDSLKHISIARRLIRKAIGNVRKAKDA